VDLFEKELQELIARGKAQGYLTYDEVNAYLPDDEVDPYRLDNLLITLEEQGIDLVQEAPEAEFYDREGRHQKRNSTTGKATIPSRPPIPSKPQWMACTPKSPIRSACRRNCAGSTAIRSGSI